MYKWFLAWRYLHTKLIAIFGILSVTLCVAMVLVVVSVMGGFVDTIRARARGMLADLIIDAGTLQGWPYFEEFAEFLEREAPDIVDGTTPVIHTYGLLRVPATGYTKPVGVVGIDLPSYAGINDFRRALRYDRFFPGTTSLAPTPQPVAGVVDGQLRLPPEYDEANRRWRAGDPDPELLAEYNALPFVTRPPGPRVFDEHPKGPGYLDEAYPGVILGNDLINRRESTGEMSRYYPVGQTMALTLLPLTRKGNVLADPVRLNVRYVDDANTGVYEIDSKTVYIDFTLLQKLLAMDAQERVDETWAPPRSTQLLVNLKPDCELLAGQAAVADLLDRFRTELAGSRDLQEDDQQALFWAEVHTWEDLQRPFIVAIEKEKVLVTLLFGVISLVALLLIGCIFFMIVKNKTRDIGVLKAVGASGPGVAGMFIVYAGTVGLVGSILGSIAGGLFVWYINDIQTLLITLNPDLRVWDPSVYSFDKIPNVVKTADVCWIACVAIFASMVGALIPATLAGRVWPVEALRYE